MKVLETEMDAGRVEGGKEGEEGGRSCGALVAVCGKI